MTILFRVMCGTLIPATLTTAGDTAWLMELSGGTVSPSNPSVTVRLSAQFPQVDYAWAQGRWAVLAGEGEWSGMTALSRLLHGSPGRHEAGSVLDISLLQLNFQSIRPDPANPLAVWEGVWTATNFAPRSVRISTETTVYDAYTGFKSSPETRLAQLTEAEAFIRVIPAPAAGTVVGLFLLMGFRRRRG